MNGNTEMLERIKSLMRSKNVSQVELARMCGTTQSAISPAINGKRVIGEKVGRCIAEALGVSYKWLLTGEDDIAQSSHKAIPEYDKDFSCGNAVMYNDSAASVVGSLSMAEYANATAIVRATGNSMHPLISSGDKVIIKEVENWPENIIYGQIYGVETDGDIRTIKRVRRSSEEGVVILEPINKDEYDNTPIQAAQITKMWLVLGCIKQFV